MIFIINKSKRTKNNFLQLYKKVVFSVLFIFISFHFFAQDSIPEAPDFTENKELDFQQFFFKALSEKSIGNYQKSIEYLESCNQILANNITVYFEFSKNYLALNNTLLATEYIERALEQDVTNIWMLKHLVKIKVKDRNFKDAIKTQKEIVLQNPKERAYLVRLHMQNNNTKEALKLINTLEKENALPSNLKFYKERLVSRNLKNKGKPVNKEVKLEVKDVIERFKNKKSFTLLKEILNSSQENPNQLLKYSTEGISLFPAQPFVYLMNGKALNLKQDYKKAITVLKNGIDFVIEDKMEAEFYNEIARSYKALGNKVEENTYKEKSKKIKS